MAVGTFRMCMRDEKVAEITTENVANNVSEVGGGIDPESFVRAAGSTYLQDAG